jgi:hypothetical protein
VYCNASYSLLTDQLLMCNAYQVITKGQVLQSQLLPMCNPHVCYMLCCVISRLGHGICLLNLSFGFDFFS